MCRPDPLVEPIAIARWRRGLFGSEALEALLVALVFATFVRAFLVQAFRIPSESMEPALMVGDHVLVNKFIYGPTGYRWEERLLPRRPIRRGDLVVFRTAEDPPRDFIKRCVALAGDEVEMRDKQLWINGGPVADDEYVRHVDQHIYPDSALLDESLRGRDNFPPRLVPARHAVCLGDNRDLSQDSRFLGPVPQERVKGRGLLVYWSSSPRRIGTVVR